MLTTGIINPPLMKAISLCGHGDKILISDGNYPIASKSGNAEKIYLALTKDIPTVTQVLESLRTVVNFEKAELMSPDNDIEPDVYSVFKNMLIGIQFQYHSRFDFYEVCEKENVRVAIMSGESRTFANILLTVGVS